MAQPSQADIFAALSAQSSSSSSFRRNAPTTAPYSEFAQDAKSLLTIPNTVAGTITNLIADDVKLPGAVVGENEKEANQEKEGAENVNSRRLYCPRQGCGSVILSEGAGHWVVLDGQALPHDPSSPFPPSTPLGSGGVAHWLIPSSPFAFDNIGFSRPDATNLHPLPAFVPKDDTLPASVSASQAKVKWLICAECDLGPLGWSFEGGSNAWVAVDRVRYGEIKK